MSALLIILGAAILGFLALSRMLFLARSRAGGLMYFANVALETVQKRVPGGRWPLEAILVLLSALLIGAGSRSTAVALAAIAAYLLLVIQNLLRERRILRAVYASQEPIGLRRSTPEVPGYPSPGLHPRLSVNLEGPFVARWPEYHLGACVDGAALRISLLIGNHARVPCQRPVRVELSLPAEWNAESETSVELPPIASGRVKRVEWTLRPRGARRDPIRLRVSTARFDRVVTIHHDGAGTGRTAEIASASITRYPGARRSAFSLRGDMDLYDTATFQTIAGLEDALGLSMRYGIAQTMYLSTRLSLDPEAAREWAAHYGVDRGAAEIPAFIRWMNERVELRHEAPYPVESSKPFVMELGNHGHLHYATDTAGHPGNAWRAGARAGEGHYPWQGADRSSLADQRDNMREAARWCERSFGFVPKSWAKPGRGNDAFSPAAVEAAGCEVATGSDIRARDNVIRQPPPHHPAGTRIVELTARYPSDPEHVQHAAMLEFWMHRGHRLARPVVILVHQHMRQFDGVICERITEHLLDHAVNGFNGDLWINTVYGVGRYWLDVLSPETRTVEVRIEPRGAVVVNRGDRTIREVPVDLRLRDGRRMTRLVDLAPGETLVSLSDGLERP